MLSVFRLESFFSIWYWAFTVLVWTLVCQRTLGVPHDMLVRAARLPEVAERVDLLARIAAERLAGLGDSLGVAAAAVTGFALAALATLAYGYGVALAEAAFLLAFPLSVVAFGTMRVARQVRAKGLAGEALRRRLSRRRAVNQGIAMLAMVSAAIAALGHPPRFGF
ncbi:hypothetical protein [Amaricoccus sp.]|uniref:hypothetical protein n=1 Tax=Amaricoccus sp. TaxID=1872485 RepID=UPI001B536B0C|nr:hypothetical protein [Amaricoccus sp.]MBP7240928.1 hypothetical protein [Amaricoccus sp.]